MRLIVLIAALALIGCDGPIKQAGERAGADPSVGTKPASGTPTVTPILRTGHTISDQPLRLPPGAAEMAAVAVEIPAGAALPIHQHPWSRFFYVERGTLRVVNHDTGASKDFKAGQVQAEALSQWHAGHAVGEGPVRLIVIDLVPPGVNNMIMKPAGGAR